MKFLVTGVTGQLGFDVVKELQNRGYHDVLGVSSKQMDITNEEETKNIILNYKPDVIIHAAAYTNVEKAEEEVQKAYEVNAKGTRNIVKASIEVGAKLIYVSTDYVFDGEKDKNQAYEIRDLCNPINQYGKTKFYGEKFAAFNPRHFIVRVSWVFGQNGQNFVKKMIALSETKKELSVVCDQYGSPTYTVDLARLLVDMSFTEKYGVYHATNEGFCSWYEFAQDIFRINHIDIKINPVSSDDFVTKAKRPKNSKLSKNSLEKNGFERLPSYQDALERYKMELEKEKSKVKKMDVPF